MSGYIEHAAAVLAADAGFCTNCWVSLDLHPSQEQTDDGWECDIAEQKARLIESFSSVGRRP